MNHYTSLTAATTYLYCSKNVVKSRLIITQTCTVPFTELPFFCLVFSALNITVKKTSKMQNCFLSKLRTNPTPYGPHYSAVATVISTPIGLPFYNLLLFSSMTSAISCFFFSTVKHFQYSESFSSCSLPITVCP